MLSLEIKEIVFDYFNIITKEYEIAFEKWKVDDDYKNQITEIKKQIDEEYLEKKYEVPPTLTKEKAQELVDTKQSYINQALIKMISGEGATNA